MAPIVAWLTLYHVPRFGFVIHHPILKNRVFFCPVDPNQTLRVLEILRVSTRLSEGVHGKNPKTPRLS